MSEVKYTLAHVGINTEGEENAQELADLLCHVFNAERSKETPAGLFVSDMFELMRKRKRGANGHIGLRTNDVEAAMADLASKGYTFQEDTIKRDENGKIYFVYLEQEIAGFAFHLTV